MTTVEEHLATVLDQIERLREVTVPLSGAHGLVLTRDVTSPVDLPRFADSAMDGYAVRAADVAAASERMPVVLPVLETVAAGDLPTRRVEPGTVLGCQKRSRTSTRSPGSEQSSHARAMASTASASPNKPA